MVNLVAVFVPYLSTQERLRADNDDGADELYKEDVAKDFLSILNDCVYLILEVNAVLVIFPELSFADPSLGYRVANCLVTIFQLFEKSVNMNAHSHKQEIRGKSKEHIRHEAHCKRNIHDLVGRRHLQVVKGTCKWDGQVPAALHNGTSSDVLDGFNNDWVQDHTNHGHYNESQDVSAVELKVLVHRIPDFISIECGVIVKSLYPQVDRDEFVIL